MCYNQTQEHDSYDHKCIVSASSGHPGQRYNRVPGKKITILSHLKTSLKRLQISKGIMFFCMVFPFLLDQQMINKSFMICVLYIDTFISYILYLYMPSIFFPCPSFEEPIGSSLAMVGPILRAKNAPCCQSPTTCCTRCV